MNQTLFKQIAPGLVGAVTAATVGNINPANAAQLDFGRINLIPQQGVEILNNAVDFNSNDTDFVPGDIDEGGNYIINFATGGFADFGFLDKTVRAVDIYTPSSAIPGGTFIDGENYNLVSILPDSDLVDVDGMQGLPFLYYDLTDNGNFDDGDDAIFYATGFTRSTREQDDGSFDVSLNFQGFIDTVDSDDSTFEKTIVDVTLFNGATSLNPETLPAIDGTPPTQLLNSDFTNFDGVQEVEDIKVPEASNIVSILSVGALALSIKLRKSKIA